jgi:formate hydrogenlyase regulatory protein HycA
MFNLFRKKGIPDMLPIMRMEDYHTHYLGQCSDGRLFWGYETFVFSKPMDEITGDEDWKKSRWEYAVLHTFDKKGNYLTTKHWFAGTTADVDNEKIKVKLQEMVSDLGQTEFKDIKIKTFQTVIDGFIFGLVPDNESLTVELQPSSTISFQEPWDGEYFT